MDQDALLRQLTEKIEDLGWDYDRFSQAGQATYDEICSLLAKLTQ